MNKDDLYENRPVIVITGVNSRRQYPGKVVKVARKYVTIEFGRGQPSLPTITEFHIDTQKERGNDSHYAAVFCTVEQQRDVDRREAAELHLRAIGLDYSRHMDAGPRPSLDEQEAIVDLIARMRNA